MAQVTITLDRDDLGQIMDGLTVRMESYEATARVLDEDFNPDNIIIEEVRDSDEARRLADCYKRILDVIMGQLK